MFTAKQHVNHLLTTHATPRVLDGDPTMHGIELTPERPLATLVSLSEHAETAGFDTIFTSCHYNNRDPFMALARIAHVTTLDIGPGVANPYQLHPVVLASSIASLAEVADGTVIFGLGAGDRSTLATLGITRNNPLRRVLETMHVSRALFDGERVTHQGTFEATDAKLNYQPPSHIPIYVGAQGPHMLRMSAKHADGILINASHPRDFTWALENIDIGKQQRTLPNDPEIIAFSSVSVATNKEEAIAAARPPVAFIVGGASDRVLNRHNIDPARAHTISGYIESSRFSDAFEHVTPRMISSFCIAGTPDTITSRTRELSQYVDGIVAGSPLGPDPKNAITLLGSSLPDLQ